MSHERLNLDADFLFRAFAELGVIGRNPSGRGYQRLSWSQAERDAHQWFRERAQGLGFEAWTDPAGNSFADFSGGASPDEPALAIGSHLDSVPFGGAFDGGLGVVAALIAAKAIRDQGATLRRPLRLAAFTDEEGARFGTGLLGSKALAGALDMDLVRQAADQNNILLKDAMARYGFDLEALPSTHKLLPRFFGYLELHIEQGPRLEQRGIATAAVSVITGIRHLRLEYLGQTNHAGTTPKPERRNALRAAAEAIAAFSRWVDNTDNLVANPGHITVHPNATNVVPGEAQLDWDIRSPDPALLDQAVNRLTSTANEVAQPFQVTVRHHGYHDVPACAMSEPWMRLIEEAAGDLHLSTTRLVSWAGHDASVLGRVIPAAMILVPSRAGVSHAPEESSSDSAMLDGTRLLAQTAFHILTEEGAGL